MGANRRSQKFLIKIKLFILYFKIIKSSYCTVLLLLNQYEKLTKITFNDKIKALVSKNDKQEYPQ